MRNKQILFLALSVGLHCLLLPLTLAPHAPRTAPLSLLVSLREVAARPLPRRTVGPTHRAASVAAQPVVPSAPVDLGKDVGVETYQSELRHAIELHKEYPRLARARHQQGVVEVGFTILRDGHLENLRFRKASEFSLLNDSALNSVRAIGQFKPFPEGIRSASLEIVVPIHYQISL